MISGPGGKRCRLIAFEILALDVDGTLLDPDGTLASAHDGGRHAGSPAGIRPVLCTGRRYRRAWPIAEQLELDAPLVCNSGAIIKDPASHRTIWRADFDGALSAEVLDLFQQPRPTGRDLHRPWSSRP